MSFTDYFNWGHDNLTKLSAIAAGIAVLWKPVVHMRKFFKNFSDLHSKISAIENEIKPNGGSSIKDAIQRIEKNLIVLEQSHKVVLDSSGIGYWKTDKNGEWVEVGKHLTDITGRAESEILGNNWTVWLDKEDRERIVDAWKFSIKERTIFDQVYTFLKPDKTKQKVHGLAYPLFQGNELIGFYGTLEKTDG